MLLKRMTPKIFCHQSTLLHRFISLSKIQKSTLLLGQNDSLFKLKVNNRLILKLMFKIALSATFDNGLMT